MAAPTIWNQLPNAIKSSETIDTFRQYLKIYLFKIVFPLLIVGGSSSNDDFCLPPYMSSQIILFIAPLSFDIYKRYRIFTTITIT